LQPRAGESAVVGERNGALLVRVTAPPVEGRANVALCELLATRLRLPKRAVSVVRGETGRDKVVRIEGMDEAEVRRALGLSG
jgi:uncharacterized protein (TIGR00251 family)